MKKIKGILFAILSLGLLYASNAQVGGWQYHFAAAPLTQMAFWGNEVYAMRSTDLLCYNTEDNTLSTLSKRNGLSGVGVTALSQHKAANCLVIGYKDGNVDLYYGSNVHNMPDIKNKNILGGDKAINRIFTQERYAYLACSFGVVIMDVQKQEFRDTYYIGDNNSNINVSDVGCDKKYIWASTEKGLKFADKNALNLNDYAAWTTDSTFGRSTVVDRCCKVGENWYALIKAQGNQERDIIYKGKLGGSWEAMDTNDIKRVSMISVGDNYLVRGVFRKSTEKWSLELLDKENAVRFATNIEREYDGAIPHDAYLDGKQNLWAVGSWASIYRFDHDDGLLKSFYYWGPSTNSAFSMTGKGNKLLVAAGGYDESYAPIFNNGDISLLKNREWSFINGNNISGYGRFSAVVQVLEDPNEVGHFFLASAVEGVMEIRGDKVVNLYNSSNSPLQDYGDACRIYGIAFDAQGNLWMLNIGSTTALVQLKRDGTWKTFDISAATSGLRLSGIMIDYWQHIWIIDNKVDLYVVEIQGDNAKVLQINENKGSSITTAKVNCLIEDDLGLVWIGTERGVKLIDKHASLFDSPEGSFSSVECKNIMVPSGEYIIELLKNEEVTSILYDGSNRKWIGTRSNGTFLVSSDGSREIEHFTTENSHLLSDRIMAIGTIPYTGDIFFATPEGLCSYQGTSAFREAGAEALPFPNPVPPLYEGYISIKNLPIDAEVKITDAAGRLIYEGRATGGQLSWNGYNMQGKRPSAGVLLVFASTSEGSERMVCKIFYAR